MPSRLRLLVASILLGSLAAVSASATEVTLDFSSLPSAQGWTYEAAGADAGTPEGSVFSIAGDTLVLNSMGKQMSAGGSLHYLHFPALDDSRAVVLEMRARLTNIEGHTSNGCFGYGFAIQAGTATRRFQLGFMSDRIRDNCPVPRDIAFLDNTVFHDYRVEMFPSGKVRVLVDGVLVAISDALTVSGPPRLTIGDDTGTTNARAEITSYSVTQPCPVEPGPDPSPGLAGWNAENDRLPQNDCPTWRAIGPLASLGCGLMTISTSANGDYQWFEQRSLDLQMPNPFVMEFRTRLVSGSSSTSWRAPVMVAVHLGSHAGTVLGIGTDDVFLLADNLVRGQSAAVQTDDTLHTYRIEVDGSSVSVSYDGTPLLAGGTYTGAGNFYSYPSIEWGEISGDAYGTSEWQFVAHNASAVPCELTEACALFESFDGDTLTQPDFWALESSPCGSPRVDEGELILAEAAGCAGAGGGNSLRIDHPRVVLRGDFDVTVNYRLPVFPVPASGGDLVAGLSFGTLSGGLFAAIERYNRELGACNPSTSSYKSFFTTSANCNAAVAWHSTSDLSGKFRVQRTGSLVRTFYWSGTWIQTNAATVTAEDVCAALYARNPSGPGAAYEARFDSLCIRADAVVDSCASITEVVPPPGNDAGLTFTALCEGTYRFEIVEGAWTPWQANDPLFLGWKSLISLYKNRVPTGADPPADFHIGCATYQDSAIARATGVGSFVDIALEEGEPVVLLTADCATCYTDNRGGVTVRITKVPPPALPALLVETFPFADDTLLCQGDWYAHSATGNKAIQVVAEEVVVAQGAGSGEDVSKAFIRPVSGNPVYTSFTFRIPSGGVMGSTREYFAHFRPVYPDLFGYVARIWTGPPAAGGDFELGIATGALNATPVVAWPTDLAFDTNYRVVVAYDAVTGASTLWLDPEDASSPSITSTSASVANKTLGYFSLRQSSPAGASYVQIVDNIGVSVDFDMARTVDVPRVRDPRTSLRFAVHPNPGRAGASRWIEFVVPVRSDVELSVFDVSGRRLETLARGVLDAGPHRIEWPAAGQLRPGLRFVRLKWSGGAETRRVVTLQ